MLLHDWLNRPHVAERWDGPLSYQQVAEDYDNYLLSGVVFPYLVYVDSIPIGYIQKYDAFRAGGGWWPDEPEGTWGVDQFIGEESFLNQGLGPEFLCQFTNELFDDIHVQRIITDPDPDNARAIRAYEKAGFQFEKNILTPDGPAYLMQKLKPTN